MLAALPHKKEADPPQDTSAIYTFLDGDDPTTQQSQPAPSTKSRKLVTHIAEFAHRPEYRCSAGNRKFDPGPRVQSRRDETRPTAS